MITGRHLADFKPPPWLANRHLQTLLPRALPQPASRLIEEQLELPDGDFVELAWVDAPALADETPLLVLFHGLEGSVDSPYARHLLDAAERRGWRAVLMHFRGCGTRLNRLPRAYHSGDTADARWCLESLAQRYPAAPRVALGVSLGANMLLKLVAEDTDNALGLTGAIAVAPPVDLAACADTLQRGVARVYQRHLLGALKAKVAPRLARQELPLTLSRDELARFTTLRAYDDAITAPLHGFKDAADYYHRAAAGPLLETIALPTLILHADDDPFMPQGLYNGLTLGPGIRLETARHGGHVGYVEWQNGRPASWLARRVGRQLDAWSTRASTPAISRSDS
ncbi:hydrolase [Halomonas eurihalina]|uniref:Hydrolase n=1 Tax=Halomonas eurihalina TaxID=42566 RepID=A0A5D9D3N9_HALER|nr:hydrolase [Halomonas eurihalina]MDR5858687.1 hydrolase [Halomonas eurihalina]TZG38828.1 hydrolase [Halomonas eurihalina]